MAVDPNKDEPSVEISAQLYKEWVEIRELIKVGQAEEKRLREEIEKALGTATAATVGGVKVITYRPRQGWSTKDLMRDHGELTQHYMTYEMTPRLDIYQFAAHHPEIAAKYQTRDFKEAAQ
jgi:hypothetical protein